MYREMIARQIHTYDHREMIDERDDRYRHR